MIVSTTVAAVWPVRPITGVASRLVARALMSEMSLQSTTVTGDVQILQCPNIWEAAWLWLVPSGVAQSNFLHLPRYFSQSCGEGVDGGLLLLNGGLLLLLDPSLLAYHASHQVRELVDRLPVMS